MVCFCVCVGGKSREMTVEWLPVNAPKPVNAPRPCMQRGNCNKQANPVWYKKRSHPSLVLYTALKQQSKMALLLITAVFTIFNTAYSQSQLLYPFGNSSGDTTLASGDDNSAGPIALQTGTFPFFGTNKQNVFVNNNGDITFTSALSSFNSESFPITNGAQLIAPFWADVDTRGTGSVFYRETRDSALLFRAQNDIRMAFPAVTNFNPTFLFIVTWDRVGYFNRNTDLVNTFQCVLITDTQRSFVIFLYPENGINWTSGDSGIPAQVGFNAGDGVRFFSVPGSQTSDIVNIEATSNVGRPGVWIFRADEEEIVDTQCSTEFDAAFQIAPRLGNAFGGTPVTISGPCFSPTDEILCRFDGVLTFGFYLSETRAFCVSVGPNLSDQSQLLEISVINATSQELKFYGRTQFFFVYPDEIADVTTITDSILFTPGHRFTLLWSPDSIVPGVDPTSYTIDISVLGSPSGDPVPLAENITNTGSLETIIPRVPAGVTFSEFNEALNPDGLVVPILFQVAFRQFTVQMDGPIERLRRGQVLRLTTVFLHTFTLSPSETVASILRSECEEWVRSQPNNIGQQILENVLPCPPTATRARWDSSFREDIGTRAFLNTLLQPGTATCFTQVRLTSSSGNQCCYNNAGALVTGSPGGGSVDLFSPENSSYPSHFLEDVIPYVYCCTPGTFADCDQYYRHRPSDNGTRFNPPVPACVYGDPHIVTLDGAQYTFNGHGEFAMVEVDEVFTMQGRMEQTSDPSGSSVNATVFTAIVAQAVNSDRIQFQVGGVPGFSFLETLVNGELVLISNDPLQFGNVTVSRTDNGLRALFASGAFVEVRLENGFIATLLVSLPLSWRGSTMGLMGNYNGDTSDDLMPRSSSQSLPLDSSMMDIHELFGVTWIIDSPEDSLFTYRVNETWATFYRPNFVPTYEVTFSDPSMEAQARALCGEDTFCLFDVATTNNLAIGSTTLAGGREYDLIVESFQPVTCSPSCANGACVENNVCSCSAGFSGAICDSVTSVECDLDICRNNGMCRIAAGSFTCDCPPGFTGSDCSMSSGAVKTTLPTAGLSMLLAVGLLAMLMGKL